MYSVMLLMALSGSAETPEFGRRGCDGCAGYVVSCGGYYDCGGCRGGGLFSRLKGRRGCHGCAGWYDCHGCAGWHGCAGACHGAVYHHCAGCAGACHGAVYYHCAGCAGCHGMPPAPPKDKPKDMPPPKDKEKPKGTEEGLLPAPATLVVELPADAKLTIDDAPTTSTSAVRTFVTPDLAPEKDFSYTLKAEIVRDGRTLTLTEKVGVRAGEQTRVSLEAGKFTSATVAQK
jgi:uncharacterized protein (TIGR03000 family)